MVMIINTCKQAEDMDVYFKKPWYTKRSLNVITIANHLWQGGQGRGQGGWQQGQMPACQAKWAKDKPKNLFHHLEAGVTVVGPHLYSSRQLAWNITLGVTSHQRGVSPQKSILKCSSRIRPESESYSVSPDVKLYLLLDSELAAINVTVWFPRSQTLETIGWDQDKKMWPFFWIGWYWKRLWCCGLREGRQLTEAPVCWVWVRDFGPDGSIDAAASKSTWETETPMLSRVTLCWRVTMMVGIVVIKCLLV